MTVIIIIIIIIVIIIIIIIIITTTTTIMMTIINKSCGPGVKLGAQMSNDGLARSGNAVRIRSGTMCPLFRGPLIISLYVLI